MNEDALVDMSSSWPQLMRRYCIGVPVRARIEKPEEQVACEI